MQCSVPYKETLSKYCPDQAYDPTFPRNRLQNPHSESPLRSLMQCHSQKHSCHGHLLLFSFLLSQIQWHRSPFLFYNFRRFFLQGDDFNSTRLVKTVLWVALLKSLVLKKLKKQQQEPKTNKPPPHLSLLGAIDKSPKDISCSIAHIGRESLLWAQSF